MVLLSCFGFVDELNIILQSYDLASCVCLYVPLRYASRFVIKEAMGVSAPGDTPHVNSIWMLDSNNFTHCVAK